MDYDILDPSDSIEGYSARQVESYLGIGTRRLRQYCALLREACPGEFDHPLGSAYYSIDNYRALKKVRQLFKVGATHDQVKTTLKLEGF